MCAGATRQCRKVKVSHAERSMGTRTFCSALELGMRGESFDVVLLPERHRAFHVMHVYDDGRQVQVASLMGVFGHGDTRYPSLEDSNRWPCRGCMRGAKVGYLMLPQQKGAG